MLSNRHWFAIHPLPLPQHFDITFQMAMNFEIAGNWYLAGKTYSDLRDMLDKTNDQNIKAIIKAQILTRAASCFEIAQDSRASARYYEKAASEVASIGSPPHLSAELYNRAAFQFTISTEHFFAGNAWVSAAQQFLNVNEDIIHCTENLTPLPISSLKSHLCGVCFEAAGMAYEKSPELEMHAVGAYWRAGNAYSEGIPNIQAFYGYRRALNSNIRYYGTLEAKQLRYSLPLTVDERTSKIDPITTMEAALTRCNNHHQEQPGDSPQSRLETNRQMMETFHRFNMELQAIGNSKEASYFRIQKSERQRIILIIQKRYGAAFRYLVWKMTSKYGESLAHWSLTCTFVILAFALLYNNFNLVTTGTPSNDQILSLIDYIYFSIITFSTLGYGDMHPIGVLGQTLACLEVCCGLLMFGLLLSFVGNRFQRN